MRKNFTLLAFVLLTNICFSQSVCNPTGNLFIYSNYEGGVLYLNVDVNVPDIKIGIVTYETVVLNLIGPFASNVTGVHYAGAADSVDNSCSLNLGLVQINGLGAGGSSVVSLSPVSTLTNSFGSSTISCGLSCQTNVNQGGCNTPDQIEHYIQQQFPTAILRSHTTTYSCWTGDTLNLSSGGNCCALLALGLEPKPMISNKGLNLYPNPVSSGFRLDLEQEEFVEIYDAQGRLVFGQLLKPGTDEISMINQASGIYHLRLKGSNRSAKLIRD